VLFGSSEAVAAVPHHFPGLAHIAELLGQFQQPDLGANDLLCSCLVLISFRRSAGAVPARREKPRPFSGFALETNNKCQIKSKLYSSG
jgi:hypothetical protein